MRLVELEEIEESINRECITTKAERDEMKHELASTLWYCSKLAAELGLQLEDIIKKDIYNLKRKTLS